MLCLSGTEPGGWPSGPARAAICRLHAAPRGDDRGRPRQSRLHGQRDGAPLEGGDLIDPFGGEADLAAARLRAVSPAIFDDDPLRLLRAVRLEDELGFRLDEETESPVREHAEHAGEPAGERIPGELERMSPDGFRRAGDLGLLAPLGGDLQGLERVDLADTPGFVLVAVFGERVLKLLISNEPAASPARSWPPSGRRTTQGARSTGSAGAPSRGALSALAFLGATDLYDVVRAARAAEPPSRCGARTSSSLASRRGPKSAACSSSSPRNEPSARSGAGTRRWNLVSRELTESPSNTLLLGMVLAPPRHKAARRTAPALGVVPAPRLHPGS